MLMRCAGRTAMTMGGMAMLAGLGPFLAGLGVGAAVVGGALAARQAMERRRSWRDEPTDSMPPPMSTDATLPDAPPL